MYAYLCMCLCMCVFIQHCRPMGKECTERGACFTAGPVRVHPLWGSKKPAVRRVRCIERRGGGCRGWVHPKQRGKKKKKKKKQKKHAHTHTHTHTHTHH